MIATILPSSSNFHAVGYNEHKVSQGDARLLEIKNFGPFDTLTDYTPEDLVTYLQKYSSRNDRIKNSQFHLAISCKGHEYSEEELVDFAHKYLDEMGYGLDGQPLLIYLHNDTDNRHLHIITSRVDPNGKKIDHSHERRRSQAVIDRILGLNSVQKCKDDIEKVKLYSSTSLSQFRAVLSSLGYESYQWEDSLVVKKGGSIKQRMPIKEITALLNENETKRQQENDRNRRLQLRKILLKYRDLSSSRNDLKKEMSKLFGIDLIFIGPYDNPTGYILIDHKNKKVYNGSQVLRVKDLLDFSTQAEKIKKASEFIRSLLVSYPDYTAYDINKKLRHSFAYIRKGVLYHTSPTEIATELDKDIKETLDKNFRANLIEYFKPATIAERELLLQIYKLKDTDKEIPLFSVTAKRQSDISELQDIFSKYQGRSLRDFLKQEGYVTKRIGDRVVIFNLKQRKIYDLKTYGLNPEKLYTRNQSSSQKQSNNKTTSVNLPRQYNPGDGSSYDDREWEVGNNNYNPDDMKQGGVNY